MTIQEAIRSERKYKRESWDFWHDAKSPFAYNTEDILADDWEIEREPREIWVYENENGEIYSLSETKPNSIDQRYSAKIIKFREVIE